MLNRSAYLAGLVLAISAPWAAAAPYIPANGSVVIERLPIRTDPAQRELARLRAELAANPNDLTLATRAATEYIATARRETDPRYYGYAQAALAPWWSMAEPPHAVRLLRATLLQSTHRFPEALRDLDAIVKADPANSQAWLTRATVQTVRGDFTAATESCSRLSALAPELISSTCSASVGAMTGRAKASEDMLAASLQRSADADTGVQVWVITLLGEMAERRGDARAAEAHFKRALQLDPRDSYLIGAYADFLLDQRRPADVVALVKDYNRIDALLLRHALALQQMSGLDAALRNADAELAARFNAAQRRGDTVHQREQARYELHVRGNRAAGLELAQKNWAVQKETADLRILLEAALAAGDAAAAAPALEWARKQNLEDVNVARLAARLKAGA